MSRTYLKLAVALAVILVLAVAGQALAAQGGGKPDNPGGGGGGGNGGKPGEELGNNLSFPVIAADGTQITALTTPSWTTVYTGPYDGLTAEEYAIATGADWYAQKVVGNKWQGGYYNAPDTESVAVYGMDWGDNIESVSPTIGRPYRLEAALFAQAPAGLLPGTVPVETGHNAYSMVMLAYPSSPNEVQGTNAGNTYASLYTTITSKLPGLRIQQIDDFVAQDLDWDATSNLWVDADGVAPANTVISFAPELNVGGKYIFGASTGGWKPSALGTYRLTFYIPEASQIAMDDVTTIGNLVAGAWVPAGTIVIESEGTLATPVLMSDLNLSYVDVTVVQKGGRQ